MIQDIGSTNPDTGDAAKVQKQNSQLMSETNAKPNHMGKISKLFTLAAVVCKVSWFATSLFIW